MPGDLGSEQDLQRAGIHSDLRVHQPQLVERRDHAVPERRVDVKQAVDEHLLRVGRADSHQHRRQFAADFEVFLSRAQAPRDLRHSPRILPKSST